MQLNYLLNASNWPSLQHTNFIIYSPNLELLDKLKNQQNIENFWRKTYIAFALVIVNTQNNQVIAVRDHFGVEPFYYTKHQGRFIFGSILPDILKELPEIPALNTGLPLENIFTRVFKRQELYTDETYYESIYRLTPGHELHLKFTPDSVEIQKINFWNLQYLTPDSIYYKDGRDYLAHFTELLQESIKANNIDESLAIELSGGLDSSAVLLASLQLNLKPGIVMNVGNELEHRAEEELAEKLLEHYKFLDVEALEAKGFDLKVSMDRYAKHFAGPAPYIDPIVNDLLYSTVAKRGYKILLSGVGGDECVSGHVPIRTCAWSLIKTQGVGKFWENIPKKPHRWLRALKTLALAKGNWSDYEYNLLQGEQSHHVRMRVEYKSLAAKYWGFRYVFPLLYPKLVEFCYQLPLSQKRYGVINRLLIRKYLEQQFPNGWVNHRQKTGGISPAVYAQIKQQYQAGNLNSLFENLPFESQRADVLKQHQSALDLKFLLDIPAYMYKTISANKY